MSKTPIHTDQSPENPMERSNDSWITACRTKTDESLNHREHEVTNGDDSLAEEPKLTRQTIRFPLHALFFLTLATAVGLSGHQLMPASVFAGSLAILANVVVFGVEFGEVDDPRWKLLAACICLSCGMAILVALL